jgi:catechol 2,3-dioxygenase-like lactoylglutathione lyase family enzyme
MEDRMPTTIVTGVDFVTLPTRDLAAARRFYGEVLGLEPSQVYDRGDGDPIGAEFETGTVTLSIIDPVRIGREFAPNTQPVALRVEDAATARSELESRGVQFAMDTIDSGVCQMAFFTDPDGNPLMLHQRYAPRD